MSRDPRVDEYIEQAAPFASPILEHLRQLVHRHCPEVVETMRWSTPHFDYRGQPLCQMAAFKRHCAFGFWKGALLIDESAERKSAMGDFGRITRLEDLPEEPALAQLIVAAMRLTVTGVKTPSRKHPQESRPELVMPAELVEALSTDAPARMQFEAMSPSHRREYLEWVCEAKRPETRTRRIGQTLAQLREGKSLNWKYQAK